MRCAPGCPVGRNDRRSDVALIGESSLYGLTRVQGRESVDAIVTTIEDSFREACDYACLTSDERTRLSGDVSGQFLNEGAFVGLSRSHTTAKKQPEKD